MLGTAFKIADTDGKIWHTFLHIQFAILILKCDALVLPICQKIIREWCNYTQWGNKCYIKMIDAITEPFLCGSVCYAKILHSFECWWYVQFFTVQKAIIKSHKRPLFHQQKNSMIKVTLTFILNYWAMLPNLLYFLC